MVIIRQQNPATPSPAAGFCTFRPIPGPASQLVTVLVYNNITAGRRHEHDSGRPNEGLSLIQAALCGRWCLSNAAAGRSVGLAKQHLIGAAEHKTITGSRESPDIQTANGFTETAQYVIIRCNCLVDFLNSCSRQDIRVTTMTLIKEKAPVFRWRWDFLNSFSVREFHNSVQALTAVENTADYAVYAFVASCCAHDLPPPAPSTAAARLPGDRPQLWDGGRHPDRLEDAHGLTCNNFIQDETPPGGTGGVSTQNPARAVIGMTSTAGPLPCAQQQASARRPGGRRG